jgi:Leucine-rich repeat (LRR) protein
MEDLYYEVLTWFTPRQLLHISRINHLLHTIAHSQRLWKVHTQKHYTLQVYQTSWYNTFKSCHKLMSVTKYQYTFNHLITQVHLILYNLNISQLPSEISMCANIHFLGLNNNKLSDIPSEITQLPKLQSIWLNHNNFTYIPEIIYQLTQLTHLSIGYNKITHISSEIRQLTNLEYLWLSNNNISQAASLPQEILQLTKLWELNLARNPLTNIPSNILSLRCFQG